MAASRQTRRWLSRVGSVCLLAAAGGCAPALHLDDPAPAPGAFSEAPAAGAQSLSPQELAQWWKQFNDPLLSSLIGSALERNYDLGMALERVAQAQAGTLGARSRLLPSVGLGAGSMVYRGGDTDIDVLRAHGIDSIDIDRHQVGLQAAWEIDIFGQGRKRLEATRRQTEAAQADVQAVHLSLAAAVADTYIAYRGLQQEQRLLRENLKIAEELVDIAERSFAAGAVMSTDVDLARAQVSQLHAGLEGIDSALAQVRLALENLCMVEPGGLAQDLAQNQSLPKALGPVAAGQPADLLLRRPDLISAQARFEASLLQGEAARLNYWPRLSLGALLGRSGIHFGGTSLGASNFWMADLLLVLPLIDFGARKAEVQLSDSRSRQAFLAFQKNARDALFDVERALATLNRTDRQQAARQQEVKERSEVLRKTIRLYEVGDAGRLEAAQARSGLLISQSGLLREEVGQLRAQVALFRAMGGGWDTQP